MVLVPSKMVNVPSTRSTVAAPLLGGLALNETLFSLPVVTHT